ncbi:MobF family relaxase [Gordonia sputi]|uniref:MobF family relaxase n=1 Tax=Gordonia sputi TaxID=36823 RepID=UPI0036C34FB7
MLSVSTIKTSQAKGLSAYYADKVARNELDRNEALDLSEEEFLKDDLLEGQTRGATAYYRSDRPDRLVDVRTGEKVNEDALREHLLGNSFDGRSLRDPEKQALRKMARSVGYEGEMTHRSLSALRAGLHPETGDDLGDDFRSAWDEKASKMSQVSGYDLTFSAPKSVSIIAAYGDEATRERIVELHREAVSEALEWASNQGIFVARRGLDGAETIAARPVQVVGKTEFSSRAGDAHLHQHILISSAADTADGHRTSLSGSQFFNGSALIGTYFEQRLAGKLEEALGVQFETKPNGLREIAGVDESLLRAQSKRTQQIEDKLEDMTAADDILRRKVEANLHEFERSFGLSQSGEPLSRAMRKQAEEYQKYLLLLQGRSANRTSSAVRQAANLATRVGKEETEEESLQRWHSEPQNLAEEVLRQGREHVKNTESVGLAEERSALVEHCLTSITADRSTFTSKDLRKVVMAHAPGSWSPEQVDELYTEIYENEAVVALSDARSEEKLGDWVFTQKNQVLTTNGVIQQEQNIERLATELSTEYRHEPISVERVVEAAERASLTAEQQEMLAAATLSKNSMTVVQAPAGAGKTYSLAPIVELHQEEGYQVVGLATAARTADSLREANVNRSMSLARFEIAMESGRWGDGLTNEELAEVRQYQRRIEAKEPYAEEDLQGLLEAIQASKVDVSAEFKRLGKDWEAFKKAPASERKQQQYEALVKRGALLEAKAGASQVPSDDKVLLVLDEASMTNNNDLESLLTTANERGWKVVMVGDEKQLQGVGRSTGFEVVAKQSGTVNLSTTYRARDEKERRLQEAWWSAEPTHQGRAAVDEYLDYQQEHGRIHVVSDESVEEWMEQHPGEALPKDVGRVIAAENIAQQYMDSLNDGTAQEDLLAMAYRRVDAQRIGESIQKKMIDEGHLDPETARSVVVDDRSKAEGLLHIREQVRITRNNKKDKGETEKFNNGWTGVVVGWDDEGNAKVRVPGGPGGSPTVVTISSQALQEGVLTYGTSTAHAAQGRTVEKAWLLADETMEREAMYPGLTRGKAENHLVYVPRAGTTPAEARKSIREQALTSGRQAATLDRSRLYASPKDIREAKRILGYSASDDEVKSLVREQKQREAEAREHNRSMSRGMDEQALNEFAEERQRQQEQEKQVRERERRQQRGRGRAA